MKTTEIFVDQVLIGLLVLAAALLPYAGELGVPLFGEQPASALALASIGATAVALAYLLGILFDRMADTLVAPVDDAHARQLLPHLHRRTARLAVLVEGDDVAAWMGYLRSRLRLARAMTIYLPAVTVSALLASGGAPLVTSCVVQALLVVEYAALLVCTSIRLDTERSKRHDAQRADPHRRADLLYVSAAVLGLVGLTLAVSLAGPGSGRIDALLGILVLGALLTWLAAWSWWRVSVTYLKFLRDVSELRPERSRP